MAIADSSREMEVQLQTVESFAVMEQGRPTRIAIIVAGGLSIAILHHVTPHSSLLWHNVFQWLYYLPVVYAATYFGLWGGLGAAALAALGYLPHFVEASEQNPAFLGVEFAEVVVLFLVSAVTGMLADKEHRRRAELQRATEEIQAMHRELQSTFEQLKRADRLAAIGQLSASLAHEIRNPLASIRGAVDVLQQPQTPEELRREFRAIIEKECSRLEHLLASLLDFARPRPPEWRQVDVSQTLESTIALLAPAAGRNRVTLRQEVPAGLPLLECDSNQVRQVILNLTLNAIQAMPEGGEIVLSARSSGPTFIIEVRDCGHGVPPEHLGSIFDPFFTMKENGTGLGLAVAHRIVEQHHGTITARRNEDEGMTFSVLLPLRPKG